MAPTSKAYCYFAFSRSNSKGPKKQFKKDQYNVLFAA